MTQVAIMPQSFVCACGNAMTIEYLQPMQAREHTVFLWCNLVSCKQARKRFKLSLPVVVVDEVPYDPPPEDARRIKAAAVPRLR